MARFYLLRLLKDYLGHIILMGLPLILITLMVSINRDAPGAPPVEEAALFIGLIYILMFQGFGAAYTFEGLEFDFFKPFKDRLLMSPVPPYRFVLANLIFSTLISYVQSILLLVYVMIVFSASVTNLFSVLLILLLGVIFAQLFAAVLVLVLKKAAKAQAAITLYIIAAMILAGFFFPLPSSDLTAWLSEYSSPMAWTHRALYGVMEMNYEVLLSSLGLLSGATLLMAGFVVLLSRRVLV